jgi:DNA-binding MarR family transcriptional regulator
MPLLSGKDKNAGLWTLLHQTRHATYTARKNELAKLGIMSRWVPVVNYIHHAGGTASPIEISKMLFRSRNSVSQLLSRMEKEGVVTKTMDRNRKHMIEVSLTPKGMQVLHLSEKSEAIDRIFSALSKKQREHLESYLEILLEKAFEETGMEWDSSPLHSFLQDLKKYQHDDGDKAAPSCKL